MNFGSAAHEYAKHRVGFPPSFFEKVRLGGVVLDLGAGTGTLAHGYVQQGCVVCAVDVSAEMLHFVDGPVVKVVARAEDCTFAPETFDAIVCGQAWHWFDGELVAAKCREWLKPHGRLVIGSLDYRVEPGTVGAQTESLILDYNTGWHLAGYKNWLPERVALLQRHGFVQVEAHEYDESLRYTHAAWRGRMQACNGVMAIPEVAGRQQFDARLAEVLAGMPEPLNVEHRISWVMARRP